MEISRQLAGEICVRCGKPIVDILSASFCMQCSCPVHSACAAPKSPPDGGCLICGADPASVAKSQAQFSKDAADARDMARQMATNVKLNRITLIAGGATAMLIGLWILITSVLIVMRAAATPMAHVLWYILLALGGALLVAGLKFFYEGITLGDKNA